LDELGLSWAGTARTHGESQNILIKDIDGIKLAFLSYTYGTNIPMDEASNFSVNIIQKETMQNDIKRAREQGADFIFVNMHWGESREHIRNAEQVELANFLVDAGADFIIGAHPAALQQMEVRRNSLDRNVLVAYSKGNLISGVRYDNFSNITMVLNIEITQRAGAEEAFISRITYEPTFLLDRGTNARERFSILSIRQEINRFEAGVYGRVDERTYNMLVQAIGDIQKLLERIYN